MRFLILFASLIILAGCTTTETPEPQPVPQEPAMTCEEYCPTQPHIQCVGQWNISGTYPDCICEFICDVGEAEPIIEEPEAPPVDEPMNGTDVVPRTDKSLKEMLDDGILESKIRFFSENDGSFRTMEYKWMRSNVPDAGPGDISFDNVALTDVKFDGESISSIRGTGLVVFEEGSTAKARGIIIFLDKSTSLDGRNSFDIEYFPSVEHRYMETCSVQSKDLSMDLEGNWISKYFIKCENVKSS
ncbi:hypothetical protein JXA56_00090 [Candidatus Micrarchaeota archaeon]|nr:hypothetical protein [Candidatus Micrarchaeota archaeon]